jgi:hypothetical protein
MSIDSAHHTVAELVLSAPNNDLSVKQNNIIARDSDENTAKPREKNRLTLLDFTTAKPHHSLGFSREVQLYTCLLSHS